MFQVLFLTFVTSSFALNYFEKNHIYDALTCNEVTEVVVEVARNYLEDQHSVTVIDITNLPVASSFKCSKGNTFRPVDIITEVKQIQARTKFERSSVSTFPLSEAFLINTDLKMAKTILPLVSFYNPRMNILAVVWSAKLADIKTLLRTAFEEHKLLSFGVLDIQEIYERGEYVKSTVSIILYNPFYGNQTHRDPQFLHLDFTERRLEMLVKMKEFIKLRLTNLHGFPLEMNIFEYPMVAEAKYDENGKLQQYLYADGEIIIILSKLMNFTPVFNNNSGNEGMYGYQLPNGTFVGSLGDIENNRVAFAANPMTIADYNTSNSVFLQPVTMSPLYFIIRNRPTRRVLSLAHFHQFDHLTIVFTFLFAFLLPGFHWILSFCEERLLDPEKRVSSVVKSFLHTFAIFSNVSVSHPHYTGTRIVIASTMFYALISSTLFQSNIVKDLNLNRVEGKILTVEELANEGYKIKMPSHFSLIFNGLRHDKVSLMMNKTKQTAAEVGVPSYDLESIMKPGEKIAFLWTSLYTQSNYLDRFFDNETGENLFESVPEVAFEFYIANVVPKHSPFIERFNEILIRYFELGLADYHMVNANNVNHNFLIRRVRNGKIPETKIRTLTYRDLRGTIQFFLILVVTSCATFILEIIWKNLKLCFK